MASKEKTKVAEAEIPDIEVPEGSAVTVITNTVESLRGHYPKLVTEIENAALDRAKPEWVNSERKRLSDLNAAFADDPKFANDSYIAGLTVEQAKAKRHDDLVKALNEANEKIAKVRSEVPFIATDSHVSAPPPAETPSGDPLNAVEADAKAKWSKDRNLQAEFMDSFPTYLAYEKARVVKAFKILNNEETPVK